MLIMFNMLIDGEITSDFAAISICNLHRKVQGFAVGI